MANRVVRHSLFRAPCTLLHAASLLFALVGILDVTVHAPIHGRQVSIEVSPLWYLASIVALLFLLALELVDRIRVRDELEVARELQAELLPRRVPDLPGFRFAHSYRTANEVGGDYYDFLALPDGRLALMVGDASGHGMAAGLVMAIANATWKTALWTWTPRRNASSPSSTGRSAGPAASAPS